MTYLDTLLRRVATRKAQPPAAPPPARLRADNAEDRYRVPDAQAAERQGNLYAALAWIQIAITTVADVVASTPFYVSQAQADGEEQRIPGHEFEALLRRPNPAQSRFEFLQATYAWRKLTGDCYWWLNRPSEEAPPVELWIIPSGQIVPVPDGQGHVSGYLYDPGQGEPITLPPTEVVHFRTFNPLSRYVGLSAVQALALDSHGDLAAQRYNVAYYDRDNAKPDGILAFADAIEDGAWRRLQEDAKDQAGGTKRKRMMMLRSVGAGGVQWIMTHVSRADQQYLEQRTFTKEEIYAALAPGLASILAVNATEANSAAGKDTFLSMAVFPACVAIGEKIASDVLPAYGDALTGAFEDVRRADTAMELQQRAAYERTHTVDEVRQRYDGDPPLGDERGQALASDRLAPVNREVEALRAEVARLRLPAPPADGEDDEEGGEADPVLEAGKRLDRRRWRTKAAKAIAAGRSPDVPYTPDYLSDDEAMTIRAALRRGDLAGAFGGEG